MTHEQLERAARYLCTMRGVNPLNREYMKGSDSGVLCYAWENAAKEIAHHELMREAIRHATPHT